MARPATAIAAPLPGGAAMVAAVNVAGARIGVGDDGRAAGQQLGGGVRARRQG
jgi:hypothetical protein